MESFFGFAFSALSAITCGELYLAAFRIVSASSRLRIEFTDQVVNVCICERCRYR